MEKTRAHEATLLHSPQDLEPFALGGLWERWEREGQRIDSCAVIKTDATETLRFIHERIPIILSPENYDTWMDPELTDPAPLR